MDYRRQPEETPKAFDAFVLYRQMPASERSLEKVGQKLGKSTALIERWSAKYKWVSRVAVWDEEQDRIREEARATEIRKIMQSGFAQEHERVAALNRLAEKLLSEVDTDKKLWLEDKKLLPNGDDVNLIRFNGNLIEQVRGLLDDIAKETGGRIRKTEAKVTMVPKQYIGFEDLEAAHNAADEEFEAQQEQQQELELEQGQG
jgi:hypothetical protein